MTARFVVAGASLLGAVAVDFTSRILSTSVDLLLVAVAVIVVWPALKKS